MCPKRLLDLNSEAVILRENIQHARYACLSHCWGTKKLLVATTVKISTHLHTGLLVNSLPSTFRDAVTTCFNLGISYIWIDSLCIVQDDTDDWRTHSARMADIYENCFLTIAATNSSDVTGGLFRDVSRELCGEAVPGYADIFVR